MQTNSCRCVGKSLVDTAVQGVMGMCEWQKRRRIIITSFPANSGLIRCLVPHGREGQLMCIFFLSMRQ